MTNSPPPNLWRVGLGCDLRWRQWDDECIVFNPAAGDTHVLNHAAAEALQALENAPTDIDGLTHTVASALNLEPDEELLRHMQQLVDQLDDLGLIEPVPA